LLAGAEADIRAPNRLLQDAAGSARIDVGAQPGNAWTSLTSVRRSNEEHRDRFQLDVDYSGKDGRFFKFVAPFDTSSNAVDRENLEHFGALIVFALDGFVNGDARLPGRVFDGSATRARQTGLHT
jgi:hypothetical protein